MQRLFKIPIPEFEARELMARFPECEGWTITRMTNGYGVYSGPLNKSNIMATEAEATRATGVASVAFEAGYRQAQRDMRRQLGITGT